jgi:hypothetical protein
MVMAPPQLAQKQMPVSMVGPPTTGMAAAWRATSRRSFRVAGTQHRSAGARDDLEWRGGHFLPRTSNRSFDGALPPKHNVGRLYPAKPGIARRRVGPCNAFNLGIGRTTKCERLCYDA